MEIVIFVLTLGGIALGAFWAMSKFRGKAREAQLAADLKRIVDQLVGAIESYSKISHDGTIKGMVRERVAPDSRAGVLLDESIDQVTRRPRQNFGARRK